MKEVKILEVEKEVLKRIDMICRFACCKYTIKQGSIINIKGSNLEEVRKIVELINKMVVGTPIDEVSNKLEFEIKPIQNCPVLSGFRQNAIR